MPKWSKHTDKKDIINFSDFPSHFYQYKNLNGQRKEWVKQVIVDSKLYFAQASQFNDPLDCRISPLFDASRLKIESYWRKRIREQFPIDNRRDKKNKIEALVKQSRSKKEKDRLEITNNFFNALDKLGILCLSETPNNMLMWSYYADGHKGICFRFKFVLEKMPLLNKKLSFWNINYSDTFPAVNFYTDSPDDIHKAVLSTKAKAWEHEQEWRFVHVSATGLIYCPILILDGIIFGMRTNPDDKFQILEWVGSNNKNIEFYRVFNKKRSFELDIELDQK